MLTYRLCDECRTKVPYTDAFYRVERWEGSSVQARNVCWSCLRKLVAT